MLVLKIHEGGFVKRPLQKGKCADPLALTVRRGKNLTRRRLLLPASLVLRVAESLRDKGVFAPPSFGQRKKKGFEGIKAEVLATPSTLKEECLSGACAAGVVVEQVCSLRHASDACSYGERLSACDGLLRGRRLL